METDNGACGSCKNVSSFIEDYAAAGNILAECLEPGLGAVGVSLADQRIGLIGVLSTGRVSDSAANSSIVIGGGEGSQNLVILQDKVSSEYDYR